MSNHFAVKIDYKWGGSKTHSTASPLSFLPLEFLSKICVKLVNLNSFLRHGITLTYGYSPVLLRLKIIGHTERRPNLVLTAVTLTNIAALVILAVIFLSKLCIHLLRSLIELLRKRKYANLHGR